MSSWWFRLRGDRLPSCAAQGPVCQAPLSPGAAHFEPTRVRPQCPARSGTSCVGSTPLVFLTTPPPRPSGRALTPVARRSIEMRSMARFIVQTPCLRMGRARAMQSSSNFRKLWVVMVRQESPHVEGREAAKRAERAQGLPSCMLHPHRRLLSIFPRSLCRNLCSMDGACRCVDE